MCPALSFYLLPPTARPPSSYQALLRSAQRCARRKIAAAACFGSPLLRISEGIAFVDFSLLRNYLYEQSNAMEGKGRRCRLRNRALSRRRPQIPSTNWPFVRESRVAGKRMSEGDIDDAFSIAVVNS